MAVVIALLNGFHCLHWVREAIERETNYWLRVVRRL